MNWNKNIPNSPLIGDVSNEKIPIKASREAHNIADHFTQFLQPHIAICPELRNEAFKIRHNVYCEELAFEKVRADKQETDEFDEQSIFALIKHKPTNTSTSCVRLVTSNNPNQLLPIEKYCADAITNKDLNPENFKRTEIAEISRLAVKSDFRRRKADQYRGSGTGVIGEISYSETELRCFPFIAIGLYMTAASIGMNTGIKHFYVMMEPRLARSMKCIGISFQQLGAPVNYHGLRTPYYINPEIFMSTLSPGFKRLYNAIETDICKQMVALELF